MKETKPLAKNENENKSLDTFLIHGPAVISGEMAVRGAKNAMLPIMVAAVAGTEPVVLSNVPTMLQDFRAQLDVLTHLGCSLDYQDGRITLDPEKMDGRDIPFSLASRFRYSLLYLGLLAGKCGYARVGVPGGCSLGDRRYDLHLEGLKRLGAEVNEGNEAIEVKADKLVGCDIHLYTPTTTGTETIMLAALFAKGKTRIFNAHTRPEIADMAVCLNKMGANITVRNRVVEVEGGRELHGCDHAIMPGWDEALTYIIAAALTGGEICIRDFNLEYIRSDVTYLRQIGVDVFEWGGNVYASGKNRPFKSFDLFTGPYPGVNSDMQPVFAVLASRCRGESTITDQRFTERLQYVGELKKMGMSAEAYGNCAVIHGPSELKGTDVVALDIRCGAALVLAACAATGITKIHKARNIQRGYENVPNRMKVLGVEVEAVQTGEGEEV